LNRQTRRQLKKPPWPPRAPPLSGAFFVGLPVTGKREDL
jgi:hypothetical protein